MTKEDAQAQAIEIVKKEVETWRDPTVFITDKVAFAIKPLIRQLRKNYYGVFDQPKDKITGRSKTWVPLTQMVVDNTRKNVDLDTKDINFFSNNPNGLGITQLLRATLRTYLDRTYYGEDMDNVTFNVCVDPVSIMQIYAAKQKGKIAVKRSVIDPLNIYIDPAAKSIQDAYRFTHKKLLTSNEVTAMDGWENTGKAKATTKNEADDFRPAYSKTTKLVDTYEMWGLVPKSLITLNEEDEGEVEAQIVVSNINDDPVLHVLKENKETDPEGNVIKPFEDTRYMKIPWSFYGISPAMKVMDIQEWINTIVNLRINKNTVAQLGLFKVRAGSNINTQSLTRLVSNGVIKVTNMDDLDNFQIPEAGAGSYKDEETAKFWATEVTSAYDVVRSSLPSTTTATAAVIQDKNSKTSFVIVREGLGMFNEKVVQRHILKYLPQLLKKQGTVRYMSDFDEIDNLRERVVAVAAKRELDRMGGVGAVPTELELQSAMDRARKKIDGDMFIDVVSDVAIDGIETRVQVTNEKMDTGTMARNLLELMQLLPPEAQRETAADIYDVLGMTPPKSLMSPIQPQQPDQVPQKPQTIGEMGQFLEANTAQNQGTI